MNMENTGAAFYCKSYWALKKGKMTNSVDPCVVLTFPGGWMDSAHSTVVGWLVFRVNQCPANHIRLFHQWSRVSFLLKRSRNRDVKCRGVGCGHKASSLWLIGGTPTENNFNCLNVAPKSKRIRTQGSIIPLVFFYLPNFARLHLHYWQKLISWYIFRTSQYRYSEDIFANWI